MRWSGRLVFVCAVAAATVAGRQVPADEQLLDRVLAVAANQVIMLSDVRAFIEFKLVEPPAAADPAPEVLTALIERQLILSEVAGGVVEEPSEDEIDGRLAALVTRLGGADVLASVLPTVGFTIDDLRQVLRDDLRVERYLARRFQGVRQPTEAELVEYFEQHPGEFQIDGRAASFAQVRDDVRRRMTRFLRQGPIDAWIASLIERADVVRVQ